MLPIPMTVLGGVAVRVDVWDAVGVRVGVRVGVNDGVRVMVGVVVAVGVSAPSALIWIALVEVTPLVWPVAEIVYVPGATFAGMTRSVAGPAGELPLAETWIVFRVVSAAATGLPSAGLTAPPSTRLTFSDAPKPLSALGSVPPAATQLFPNVRVGSTENCFVELLPVVTPTAAIVLLPFLAGGITKEPDVPPPGGTEIWATSTLLTLMETASELPNPVK